jgi:hypothetical protein
MTYQLRLPLLAVVLFCLTSMAGCPNVEPAGQRTVAKGIVVNLRTGRPLPGAKMMLASSLNSAKVYTSIIDSIITDSRGQYTLSFTNEKGLYYAVSCEQPYGDYSNQLDLPDSLVGTHLVLAGDQRRVQELKLGTTNVANYYVSPRRVVQMLVNTRFTGYQRLAFLPNTIYLPADYQSRTVYLYQPVRLVSRLNPQVFYQQPSTVPTARFLRNQGTAAYQDTTVQPITSTPLTGDTIRATLRFGR